MCLIAATRPLRLAVALLGLIALAGCAASGPTIRTNVDPGVDFTRFRTFHFLQPLSTDREDYESGEMTEIKRWYAEHSNPDRVHGPPAPATSLSCPGA